MKRLFVLGALSLCLLGISPTACSGNKQQDVKTAKDVVKLADSACVVIADVSPNGGPANEICAKEEELKPFINLILGARKKPDAGASAQAVSASDAAK